VAACISDLRCQRREDVARQRIALGMKELDSGYAFVCFRIHITVDHILTHSRRFFVEGKKETNYRTG
jgi:hypothetical protein